MAREPVGDTEALADAVTRLAITAFELPSRERRESVMAALPPALFSIVMLTAQEDPEFAARWDTAGDDWLAQGHVLHDIVEWLLTPERLVEEHGRTDA
jgi:hypothetical protein